MHAMHVARIDHSVILLLFGVINKGSSSSCGSWGKREEEEEIDVLRNVALFVNPSIFQMMQ